MGSGKSSVGRKLSEVLPFQFIDLDAHIEAVEGMTISEIFQQKGEIYFRRKEAEILQNLVAEENNTVIATGGGTPCYGSVMQDLSTNDQVTTIYLKNNLNTLTDRLFLEKEERPIIAHLESKELLNDFIRKHLFERSYYYNKAQLVLDCDGLSVRDIVERLILKLF